MAVKVEIKGLDQISRNLQKLAGIKGTIAVSKAQVRAMTIIRDAARQNANKLDDPNTSESIAKNIVIRGAKRYRIREFNGQMGVSVGVLGGARRYANTKENRRKGRVGQTYRIGGNANNPGGDTFYWRFIEFGFYNVKAKRQIKANPFMRNAFSANAEATLTKYGNELSKEIDKLTK